MTAIAGKTGGQAFSASESVEQQCLFRWAEYVKGAYPELKLLYHIPNGGRRNKGGSFLPQPSLSLPPSS